MSRNTNAPAAANEFNIDERGYACRAHGKAPLGI
jgi:hypothetical protein